jgi:uncharacterized protein (DUF433 family)
LLLKIFQHSLSDRSEIRVIRGLAIMNNRDLIEVDLEKLSGTPCFTGTRVPVAHLFDYIEAGDSLDEFLTDFPTVTREQVLGVLELMRNRILTEYETAA